ncbi:hypothetical protein AAEU42_00925 [Pseudoflavonifractor phocaeensis]|uniref:hypothetical protein n=1 Tax=Pseudoflavonifractor phocaeensis TaxID=1870988 RepID=UPI00313E820D
MKKSTLPVPGDEEIRAFENVPVDLAARYIGWSTPTIYRALQEGRAPFGFAVKCAGGSWAYNISPGLLMKYKQGDLPTYRLREVEEIAVDGITRILDEKLGALRKLTEALV